MRWAPACLAALALIGCGGGGENASLALPDAPGAITVTSPAFAEGATIPERFTCDGDGDSPALAWKGVPRGARELALIVDDPDAGHYVHWTVIGIPPSQAGVAQGASPRGTELDNSAGKEGWTPPCPPKGDAPHSYLFAVYATDAPLGLDSDASPDDLRRALRAHAIARGVLTGRFGRG